MQNDKFDANGPKAQLICAIDANTLAVPSAACSLMHAPAKALFGRILTFVYAMMYWHYFGALSVKFAIKLMQNLIHMESLRKQILHIRT